MTKNQSNEYKDNTQQYDQKMTLRYEDKIQDGILQIGDRDKNSIDSEVTNLMFVEKFNIQALKLCIRKDIYVNLKSNTIKELILGIQKFQGYKLQNMQVDQLELENLEVLDLQENNMDNNQLYNLVKFKKLHTLDVSRNNIDLTHIHSVTSLTKLSMVQCGLKNIDLISSLVNLKELDLSFNRDFDLSPLQQVRSLTKLSMRYCGLTNIDQITQLINLEVLNLAYNQLLTINSVGSLVNLKQLDISYNKQVDITPLNDLVGLIKLNFSYCKLTQVSALTPLTNLQELDLSFNYDINITELQYLKKLTHLNLVCCNLVSIQVLRPLVNLEILHISDNNIVYLDADLNEMKNLKELRAEWNRISDLSSLEKHPNYNNLDEKGERCFDISYQRDPSEKELFNANKYRKIELPNIQLKLIQSQHKALNTALDNFKQKINATMNNARQSQIQFTVNVVRLFQFLNQFGFE
ncbi:leucine-rich_repeat domain-containing protein [Hexamita inflata]|uniref:Leucine-rich repeat domain-containing protein n=1 Tax=Hexamita inflata TaxID=28002 RepID=A0AA86US78_9EUKA|nr:leucine-rich repeat domain-containing protein [Hexamita inflata]